MCLSHVEVTSIAGDGEASEQRSFIPSYHTTMLANINRELRAKRGAEYVPRPTEQHHHLSTVSSGRNLPGPFKRNLEVNTQCRTCGEGLMIN